MYEQVKEWLVSKCQRHLVLNKDRERGRECHPESLDRSWKYFKEDRCGHSQISIKFAGESI